MAETKEQQPSSGQGADNRIAWYGLLAAPVVAVGVYVVGGDLAGLSGEARMVAAIGALMAVLWMTEGLPLPATSLLPLVLFPMTGALPFDMAAPPYASQYVFLFMGGFMIARAIERWGLHRRIALAIVAAVGTHPRHVVGGFMLATALLSMWISNTATAMMMMPIAMSVIGVLVAPGEGEEIDGAGSSDNFSVCLLLGIAYAASIGGFGTLIGTPPNALLAGFLAEQGIDIGFGQWMLLGVPFSAVTLLAAWLLLTYVVYPVRAGDLAGGGEAIRRQRAELGPMSRGQWIVLVVFVATAVLWIVRSPLTHWPWLLERVPTMANLNDSVIAMTGALVLFMIPVDRRRGVFALDWKTASNLPWGILLLFGGGLSLAEAASTSGLVEWIGGSVHGLAGVAPVVLIVLVSAMVMGLTELTSNIATAAAFLPIGFGMAIGLELEPMLLLVPSTLAASCAFMLPVATPPNAIVFGSGRVTIGQMVKAGVSLNLFVLALIPLVMYTLGAWVLGVRL